MAAAAWINQLALDIDRAVAEIRPILRKLRHGAIPYGVAPSTRAAWSCTPITIAAHEARTLIRAAQPVPLNTRPLRQQHATTLAALNTFATRLLETSDPFAGPATIAAALELRETLDAWITGARWRQATNTAGVSWPAPSQPAVERLSTTLLTQQSPGAKSTSPGAKSERIANPAMADEPPAAHRRHPGPATPAPIQRSLLLPITTSSPADATAAKAGTGHARPETARRSA